MANSEVETMLSRGSLPWHGLGTTIPQDAKITTDDALKLSGLNWTVSLQDMYYFNKASNQYVKYANRKVIARDTDGMPYGTPTDKYKIWQNNKAFEWVNNLLDYDATIETCGSLFDGQAIWILIKLQDYQVVGDKYHDYLMVSNWHDGKHSILVTKTNVRVVCQNTFNAALKSDSRWSIKHMYAGNLEDKIANATETLELNNSYRKAMIEYAETLAIKKVNDETIINLAFPVDTEASNCIKKNQQLTQDIYRECLLRDDLSNFNGTAWKHIQAASDMAYHMLPLRKSDKYPEKRMQELLTTDNEIVSTIQHLVESYK